MSRDLALERQLTIDAAALVTAVRPEQLNAFAELRAGGGPVRELERRDFGRELVEELADARNYAVWWIRQIGLLDIDAHLAGDLTAAVARSLASTALAFEHAIEARSLAVDLRSAA